MLPSQARTTSPANPSPTAHSVCLHIPPNVPPPPCPISRVGKRARSWSRCKSFEGDENTLLCEIPKVLKPLNPSMLHRAMCIMVNVSKKTVLVPFLHFWVLSLNPGCSFNCDTLTKSVFCNETTHSFPHYPTDLRDDSSTIRFTYLNSLWSITGGTRRARQALLPNITLWRERKIDNKV